MGLLLHIAWWFAPDGTERSDFTVSPSELALMNGAFNLRRSDALANQGDDEPTTDATD